MISEALRLPDAEWTANWEFLAQLLLAVVNRRGNEDDPANGRLTATFLLEKLVEKRALLPGDMDVTYTALYLYQALYMRLFLSKQWEKALALSNRHLVELERVDVGHVPEQKSMVWYQMAVCEDMIGHSMEAQEYLKNAFSVFKPEALPPHRFKEHLLNMIELCHRHDMFEKPQTVGDVKSAPFLSAAKHLYETLSSQITNLRTDHPWERIIDNLEKTMEEQLGEARENMTLDRNADRAIMETHRDRLLRLRHWMQNIVSNPNYTPKQRIAALKQLMMENDLSPTEVERLDKFIRKLRAVAELPEDYVPKLPSERPQRFR